MKINNSDPIINQQIYQTNKPILAIKHLISSLVVFVLLLAAMNYNLVANKAVNKFMEKNKYKKFKSNKDLKRIAYYPRMIQRWNMFSPTVLGRDKTIIVEATLYNGDIINPFTGETPYYDNLNYKNIWTGHSQFWRKFFSRLSDKKNKKYISSFERWLIRNSEYFKEELDGQKIRSVKIWYVYQNNPNIDTQYYNNLDKVDFFNIKTKSDKIPKTYKRILTATK